MERIDIGAVLELKNQLRNCIDEMKFFRDSKSVESSQKNELIERIDTERDLLLRTEGIIRNIEGNMGAQPSVAGEFAYKLIANSANMRKKLDEKKSVLEGAGTNEHDVIPCDSAEPEMSFDELVSGMDSLYEALSSTLTVCVYAAPESADQFT